MSDKGNWLERLLRRPVGVAAATFGLFALAAISAARLPITLLPRLDVPSLAIWTAWPDAPPERVERSVSQAVEEAVAGLGGVVEMESRSQLGGSLVRVDFSWNRDLDLAILEVRQQLDRLLGQFPAGVERPLVFPVDPSRRPLWVLALSAPPAATLPAAGPAGAAPPPAEALADLRRLAEEVVARRLEQVEGVSRVRVAGGYQRQLEVWFDIDRLAAHGLQVEDVATALAAANVVVSGGMVHRGPFRYGVELRGDLDSEAAVAALAVSDPGEPTVRLHQVAEVRWGLAERRGLARHDGEEVLLLIVEQRPDANSVSTARELREVLAAQRTELPGARLSVVTDETTFIEEAIGGLGWTLLAGAVLAAASLFLFIRRPLPIVAVAVAIPTSIAGSFIFFDLFGISLNVISLSGLALGVGMLVDNSIVVVENIQRLREEGLAPFEAARAGAAEVLVPITSSTLTSVAVFLPLAFADGLAGRLFRDQSLAVSVSLLVSLVMAMTVVPMIVAYDRRPSTAADYARDSRLMRLLEKAVPFSLERKRLLAVVTVAFVAVAVWVAMELPRQSAPRSSEGRLAIGLELPTDASLELISERSAQLESEIRAWPGVESVLADLGQRDDAFLELDPRPLYRGELSIVVEDRAAAEAVLERLRAARLPSDLHIEPRIAEDRLESLLMRSANAADLRIDLIAEERSAAFAAAGGALAALARVPELARAYPANPEGLAAYRLDFDRDALLRFGVSMAAVAAVVEATTHGKEATRLQKVGESWPVLLRGPGAGSLEALLGQRVATPSGLLPIGRFLGAENTQVPAVLTRHRQTAVVRLLADAAPGYGAEEAERAAGRALAAELPPNVKARLGGDAESFRASLRSLLWSLFLSMLLIYLILAAQLESLTLPLAVMSVVPISLGGVALSLALTGHGWNLMSLTGCVVLVGIAVKDPIVKIDRIIQLRRQGQDVRQAVIGAGRDRMRPILMTMVTNIPGLLPMAFSLGAGSELRAPLAVALIGGLLTSTLLTLTVLPVAYSWLANLGHERSLS